MKVKSVLIPIPTYGFDPSEAAIPWRLMSNEGIHIVFATPDGKEASGDKVMLDGKKLGLWKPFLQARQDAITAYNEMVKSHAFLNPIAYDNIKEDEYDAIFLPGGHDKAVKEYLESKVLQQNIVRFFNANKPVAAVCHGVVLVARSINKDTGKSVIYEYKTTSLLKSQELLAYNLTRLWLKDYYLTYPGLTTEDEVRSVLSSPNNFIKGPTPLIKDSEKSLSGGFVVKDKNYLSARWPGDVYNLSNEFIKMIKKQ